jgi:excinuclease ABC subunit A
MVELGLGYLTLDRISNTLSGGETQRIHLTRTLGSNLTASMYLLDEPSVGLHPRDTGRLVKVLQRPARPGQYRGGGGTRGRSDQKCGLPGGYGPRSRAAWRAGGVCRQLRRHRYSGPGKPHHAIYVGQNANSGTSRTRRNTTEFIRLKGARQHNLKNIDVRIPLHCLTVVSGVSGSGKTTLVRDILYPALLQHLPDSPANNPACSTALKAPVKKITRVEFVNQSPIGKSSRSNPVTYVKAYDYIRDLFASQQLSKIRGFQPKHFSFNVEAAAAKPAKAKASKSSKCSSWPMSTWNAKSAKAGVSNRRCSMWNSREKYF